jgi:hypothetical protein
MKKSIFIFIFLAFFSYGFCQIPAVKVTKFSYRTTNQVITSLPVDTALPASQIHQPLYTSFYSWSELGNTGQPALRNQYRPPRDYSCPILFEGTDAYGMGSNDLVFYAANSPFSLLNYNSGGASDKHGQTIQALFARNLKQKGNITVLGKYFNSDGHFSNQKGNSSVFNVNYIRNRENYSLVTGVSRFSSGFAENGGLKADEQLIGSSQPLYIPVNLSGADSKMNVLSWQGVQTFTLDFSHPRKGKNKGADGLPADSVARDSSQIFPSKPLPTLMDRNVSDSLERDSVTMGSQLRDSISNGSQIRDSVAGDSLKGTIRNWKPLTILHTFKITDYSRKYSDSKADALFYRYTYSEDQSTLDSVRFLSWTNSISVLSDTVRIGQFPVMIRGGLNPDFYRYQHASRTSYGSSLGLHGVLSKSNPFSGLDLSASWVAVGYNSGDYNVNAAYRITPAKQPDGQEFELKLFSRASSPDPLIREYDSNHFRWSNDFARQRESGLGIQWNLPRLKSRFEADAAFNKNYIYFDTLGLPAQHTDRMMVVSFSGTKNFELGILRSSISGLVQYSTSKAIRLPLFAGSTSTFIHHDIFFPKFEGKLEVEYGFDLRYNTAFYGYAYMPATGAFYGQNEKALGNYPYLNVFAQIKVKRTRIFVSWCHTFADLLPEQSFAVLHYPSMRPHLKYGVYWHFYD